jgi:hypothetical protein
MQQHCQLSGAPHLSESTVVAGLTVMILRTLKELVGVVATGDKVNNIYFLVVWLTNGFF